MSSKMGKIIGRGRTADVYRYEENRVLKLYHEDIKREIIDHEYKINSVINELKLNAPQAYDIVEINNRIGIVYDEAKGKTLTNLILGSKKLNQYGKMVAQLHLSLHKCNVENLPDGKIRLSENIMNQDLIDEKVKSDLLEQLNKLPVLNKLCHGDFHIDNIIIDGDNLTIIDWIDAYRGHPMLDVARSYLIMLTPYIQSLVEKDLIEDVTKMQTELAKQYLEYYFSNSEYKKEDFYEVLKIVAAARLKEQVPLEQDWLLSIIHKL